ncbi:MAG: hypothetical protein H7231_01465 [Rhodoferax sp.]|nr:hypothetical protein [Actinomycetota bacterium]
MKPAVSLPDDDVAALDERVVITSAARLDAAVAAGAGTSIRVAAADVAS